MKAPKNISDLAAELGAEIEILPDESGWHIEALAPDGMQWVESGGCSLVARIFTNWPETKHEAFNDIYERMKMGVENETD